MAFTHRPIQPLKHPPILPTRFRKPQRLHPLHQDLPVHHRPPLETFGSFACRAPSNSVCTYGGTSSNTSVAVPRN